MPHTEIKYSSDMKFDAQAMMAGIETVLNQLDDTSGHCKGRAYPSETFLHTHILVEVHLLAKPHRDAAFTSRALDALEQEVKSHLSQACEFSLKLLYAPTAYVTHPFSP